jgi:acyl-CoA reductase-like NAD-dependent aldehyde dehydrogenase
VPVDTSETVAAKARELRVYQPEWEAMGAKGRKPWLLKFQDWILDNAEHITDVLQSETGKPRAEASLEPPLTADLLNYCARNAEAFLADRLTSRVTRNPSPQLGIEFERQPAVGTQEAA